ncbi:MAG: asparagine synthase C-terminal domain-containing protein, partial [Phycisphaeraceae bacterium]|nr:asparagine synthase C-terminal domain-containing protein [Phycisphaeraceae bacterium]
ERVLSLDRLPELLSRFVDVYDEPFFDSSGMPSYLVSQLAQENGIKVILSGDGGDELFAGYRWYDKYHRRMTDPPARSWAGRIKEGIKQTWTGRWDHVLGPYFRRVGFLDSSRQKSLLSDRASASIQDHLSPLRAHFESNVSHVTSAQLMDFNTYLVDDILTKVDRASMASGVEVRVPLLDLELVETAFSIDGRLIYEGQERKALMKKAATPWLPPDILSERKKGFSVPVRLWLDQGLSAAATDLLTDGVLVGRSVLDPDGVRSALGENQARTTWLLWVAELWARRWLENESVDRHLNFGAASAKGANI